MSNVLSLDYPRTNNHCEGWHNKVNKMVGVAHPNIFKFIENIQKEQSEQEHALSRIEAGHSPHPRRPEYIARDKRLLQIVKKFHDDVFEGTFIPFLKSIAHNTTL